MAPKNNKPTTPKQPAAKAAPADQPKVNPASLSTEQFYSGEQERQAAIADVTRLRREFDTTTTKGAAAFAKDPAAQAALARLDKAKSAVGMRTSAQDLAALNRIATSDTATMKKDAQGRMTAAPTRAERNVTKELNRPSRQYFRQSYESQLNDPTRVPLVKPRTQAPDGTIVDKPTKEVIEENKRYGWDFSNARYGWVLGGEPGEERWLVGLIGGKRIAPTTNITTLDLARDQWMSDTETLGEVTNKYIPSITKGKGWQQGIGGVTPTGSEVTLDELARVIPEIKFSEFQEIIYQLTLERDTDITVDDILGKYNEMYGEG